MRYSREELAHILAARHNARSVEGTGENAFIELKLRVTPEFLDILMRGYWVSGKGIWHELDSIEINPDNGYATPHMKYTARPKVNS